MTVFTLGGGLLGTVVFGVLALVLIGTRCETNPCGTGLAALALLGATGVSLAVAGLGVYRLVQYGLVPAEPTTSR